MGYYQDFLDLCKRKVDPRSILEFYGATNIIDREDELIHSCLIDKVDQHHAHGDANPSAALNKSKLLYSCGVYGGGSLLWFVAQMEQATELSRAVELLTGFITGDDEQTTTESIQQKIKDLFADPEYRDDIPQYNESVLQAWRFIHPYLIEDRGLDPRVLVAHGVGYDESTNTIIVPHFWKQQLVGWQRRIIDSPRWPQLPHVGYQPKWKSSPEFPKYQTLYNYDFVRGLSSPPIYDRVVVMEAPLSVLAWEGLRGDDLPPAVATFGSGISETQAELLHVFDEVTIYFDHDWAGWKGALRLLAMIIHHVRCFVVLDPPGGKDPAEVNHQEARDIYSGAIAGVLAIPMLENKTAKEYTTKNTQGNSRG